ncbi:MAG: hypothetical protein Fur002_10840 [Anaerolineales bacterium]
MSIRPLDFLDLPLIARYHNDVMTLDSARALTRGQPLGAVGLLSYVNPARQIYAALADGQNDPLFGGIIHTREESFAKLLYLAPASHLDDERLPALLEHLAAQAGAWRAHHALAEVEEGSRVFLALRAAGFSVYAWQRFWDATHLAQAESTLPDERSERSERGWRKLRALDLPTAQNLHYQIVPPLLHPIEPAPRRAAGFIDDEQFKSYASLTAGMYGIALTPFIHPDERRVSEKIFALAASLPDRRGRKIYICVRSYQAWLEPVLEDLGARPLPRQAVMVKHLARLVKAEQSARLPAASVAAQPSQVSRIKTDE